MADTIFEVIYPLTITADRYNGVYSGGKFTAWNLEPGDVPKAIFYGDVSCHEFWLTNKIPCGKGETVEEAVGNLYILLRGNDYEAE